MKDIADSVSSISSFLGLHNKVIVQGVFSIFKYS